MNPKLYVLSRPNFEEEGWRRFLGERDLPPWIENEPGTPAERLIEFAGRICYMSFGRRQFRKTSGVYIANLIASGHESVLEHANWSFLLADVSRAFTHQLVRHRVGFSFSQLSQQYHDETAAEFVEPPGLSATALHAWQEATEAARRAYRTILEQAGLAEASHGKETTRALRSAARSVLPNATATVIAVTANARALRHFLRLRGALEGDIEMRLVSRLIYDLLLSDAPILVGDFSLRRLADGSPCIEKDQHLRAAAE